jgi:hypothetical protein
MVIRDSRALGLERLSHFATRRAILAALITLAMVKWTSIVLHMRDGYRLLDFSQMYVYSYAERIGMKAYTTDLSQIASRLNMTLLPEFKTACYAPIYTLCFEPIALLTPRWAYAT